MDKIKQHFPLPLTKQRLNKHIIEARKKHSRAFEPWSETERKLLLEAVTIGLSVTDISLLFQRSESAIESKLDNYNERRCFQCYKFSPYDIHLCWADVLEKEEVVELIEMVCDKCIKSDEDPVWIKIN